MPPATQRSRVDQPRHACAKPFDDVPETAPLQRVLQGFAPSFVDASLLAWPAMKAVKLPTPHGDTDACLYEPGPTSEAGEPGVVVVHEWWGLNDSIQAVAQRVCDAGFAVIAVDLYDGKVTTDPKVAMQLAIDMKTMNAMTIVESAAALLKARARSNQKVGVTGFCLGGGMALAAACHCPSASAFVPFYGLPVAKYVDWSKTLGPIQGHYAERDRLIAIDKVRAVADAVQSQGGAFELHIYDAPHAFMRADDPSVYNADAAGLAWQRALQFLRRHLS